MKIPDDYAGVCDTMMMSINKMMVIICICEILIFFGNDIDS